MGVSMGESKVEISFHQKQNQEQPFILQTPRNIFEAPNRGIEDVACPIDNSSSCQKDPCNSKD